MKQRNMQLEKVKKSHHILKASDIERDKKAYLVLSN